MDIQKYLAQSRVVPRIVCADGYRLSVQASSIHYCIPENDAGPWTHVEVQADVTNEPLLQPYDDSFVAPRVPIAVVMLVIHRHGGFSPMMPEG